MISPLEFGFRNASFSGKGQKLLIFQRLSS
jgi:hypothetical protein